MPQGDMKALTDGKTGVQLVLFGLWDLGDGQAIRGRLDGIAASGKPQSIPHPTGTYPLYGQVDITASLGTLGADYLYLFDNGTALEGPYARGGLAYGTNKITIEENGTTENSDASSLVLGLYGGYHFNRHWSTELGYRSSRFKKSTALYNSTTPCPSSP